MLDTISVVSFLLLCGFVYWYLYRNGGTCSKCGSYLVFITSKSPVVLDKEENLKNRIAWQALRTWCLMCGQKKEINCPRPRLGARHLHRVLSGDALRASTIV